MGCGMADEQREVQPDQFSQPGSYHAHRPLVAAADSAVRRTLDVVSSRPVLPTKSCACCGRVITWRKKWQRSWDDVKWCSKTCRSRRLSPSDLQLEQSILACLATQPTGATIDPVQVATSPTAGSPADHVTAARNAARRLVDAGLVEILVDGRAADPSTARGAFRVRAVPR